MKKELKEKRNKQKVSSGFQGVQLLLVQSCVCVFAVLAMCLLRVISEDTFRDLACQFQSVMINEHTVYADAYTTPVPMEIKQSNDSLQKSEEVFAPLQGGVITSRFGERTDPFDESKAEFHRGVDIAAQANTPLHAMLSGRVLYVRDEPNGYGNYLAIAFDNGSRYVFAHCSSIAVQEGQSVKRGDVVAYVGSSGRSTGHHLHLEWIVEETAVDPLTVLPESAYV